MGAGWSQGQGSSKRFSSALGANMTLSIDFVQEA